MLLFVKETHGKSLGQMEHIFRSKVDEVRERKTAELEGDDAEVAEVERAGGNQERRRRAA